MIAAGCTCPASGACLSSNQRALVSAASDHTTPLGFADLSANSFSATFDYLSYGFQNFLSRYSTLLFFIPFSPKHALLVAANAKRKGFECYFRSDNNWETKIETWAYPFELVDGYQKWSLYNKSARLPKEIHMKLQTHMMSTTGFTSFQVVDQDFQQHVAGQEQSCHPKQHYVALSGGGWRALTSHMGSLRSLSNKGALNRVKMFSSVSGGSWALSNLAFNPRFSKNVLRNDTPIANVASEWFEENYFPAMRDSMCFKENEQSAASETGVTRLLSTSILQGLDFFKSKLGSGILAANYFNFSWQSLVEQTILGGDIARQPLDTIKLAPDARDIFGNATVALNWNHLNKWNGANPSTRSKFYLQEAGGEYVQYPVYATALYKQRNDNDGVDFEVKLRGQPMDGAFELCYKSRDDSRSNRPNISHLETLLNWFSSPSDPKSTTNCLDFKLESLTLGQVVSASSAAAGGVAVQPWVESIFELVRQHAKDALKGGKVDLWYCSIYQMLVQNFATMCNQDVVVDEFLRVLGCETSDGTKESVSSAAKRWSAALQRMAIRMTANNPFGDAHAGHMAIDAVRPVLRTHAHRDLYITNSTVKFTFTFIDSTFPFVVVIHSKCFCAQGYTDNSGLGPILAEYLKNASTKGHVTVLISNQLGDHQMETYFESTPNDGGMICKDGEAMAEQFNKIEEIHQRSFQEVGGEYIPRDGEKTCAIRLASAVFFKVLSH